MMATKEQLQALLERVEKATGADRALDADLFVALVNPAWVTSNKDPGFAAADKRSFWPEGKARYITRDCKPAPQYTASIDAAVALVERMLPQGWAFGSLVRAYSAGDDPSPFYCVLVGPGNGGVPGIWDNREEASGDTKPLSIIAALLRALIAQVQE